MPLFTQKQINEMVRQEIVDRKADDKAYAEAVRASFDDEFGRQPDYCTDENGNYV